jgi:hypothetical protein
MHSKPDEQRKFKRTVSTENGCNVPQQTQAGAPAERLIIHKFEKPVLKVDGSL